MDSYDFQWCSQLLSEVSKWPIAQPFKQPVDPVRDGAVNYFEKIKHPMDLSTVRSKLNDKEYSTVEEFVDDMKLICHNAVTFNGENNVIALIANDIESFVTERYSSKPSSHENEWYASIMKTVAELKDFIRNAPEKFGVLKAKHPFDLSSISDEKRAALSKELGGNNIEKLMNHYEYFNEEKKDRIKELLKE